MIRSVPCWLFVLTLFGPPAKGATYGNVLGEERIQEIVREVTQQTLPHLGRENQLVFVTRDFEQRIVRMLTSLEAGRSPEADLRRGYRSFLQGYARFQEQQPPPILVPPSGPRGRMRVKSAGVGDTKGGGEVVEGSYSRQWHQQFQDSGKHLIVLQDYGLDIYLRRVNCGEVPCQIPPCCNLCTPCTGS
jgi:hypothetical protein